MCNLQRYKNEPKKKNCKKFKNRIMINELFVYKIAKFQYLKGLNLNSREYAK